MRTKISSNVIDPPLRGSGFIFDQLKGYYRCGRCRVCTLNSNRQRCVRSFTSTATGKTFKIGPCVTCASLAVVYLIQCPCGLQYVGRTKRAFQIRVNEHITNILSGFKKHSVSNHYRLKHNRDPSNTLFLGIDKYKPHWRGGNLVREISQMEMGWIFRLKTYTPFGLYIETDVNAFINNA